LDSDATETPMERFIAQARQRLRGLSTQHRDSVLAEARAHIAERAAELEAVGMNAGQAETTAVAAFGDPNRWARDIVEAAFADSRTGIMCRLAFVSGMASIMLSLTMFLPYSKYSPIVVTTPLVLLFAFSFMARRYQIRQLLLIGAIVAVLCFVGSGMALVYDSHYGLAMRARFLLSAAEQRTLEGGYRRELALLQLGVRTFDGHEKASTVPAALRVGGRFIVPQPATTTGGPYAFCSAFKRVPLSGERLITVKTDPLDTPASYLTVGSTLKDGVATESIGPAWVTTDPLDAPAPYVTVASTAQADVVWQSRGSGWLRSSNGAVVDYSRRAQELEAVAARPTGFDPYFAMAKAWIAAYWTILVLAFHMLAVYLGRRAYRLRRRPRSIA